MSKIHSAASRRGQGKLKYFMYFPWFPLDAALSISTFCLLFTRATQFFLIYASLMIRRSPKETTQHQKSVRAIFNVY
jgi:hypothetical protein